MSNRLVWWGYVVELIASILLVVCLALWFTANDIVSFVQAAAIDIATLFCAVMFAAALGFLWSFYTKSDTPFYRWLDQKGAFQVYLYATVYAVGVSFAATAALIVTKYVKSVFLGIFACWLLILAVLNLYSLVSNVVGVIRLNAKYNASNNT